MTSERNTQKLNSADTTPTSERTQPLPAGLTVKVPEPVENQDISINSSPDGTLDFAFDPTQETSLDRTGNNLVFTSDNGGSVTIVDFFAVGDASLPSLVLPDGTEIPLDFLASTGIDITTAAGPSAASPNSGGTSYADAAGDLLGGTDRLGSLGTDQWGRATTTEEIMTNALIPPAGEFTMGVTSSSGFTVIAGVYEDAQPHQNIGDTSLSAGRFSLDIAPAAGSSVGEIILSGLPQGAGIYLGDPANGGTLLNPIGGSYSFTEGDFTSPGIYVIPPANSDADFDINISVELTASGGSTIINGVGTIVVDAVADQPVFMNFAASPNAMSDMAIAMSDQKFEDGWAKQSAEDSNLTVADKTVAFTVTGAFSDFADGTEEHYVLVNLPAGFNLSQPLGAEVVSIHQDASGNPVYPDAAGNWPANTVLVDYYKIPISNTSLDANGNFTLTGNATTSSTVAEGNYDIKVLLASEETNFSGQELDYSNNLSFVDQTVNVDINFFNADLSFKTGWAYEGNQSGTAPADVSDGGPHASLGAPIVVEFTAHGAETITLVTLEIDPNLGTIYSADTGQPISNSNGLVSMTLSDLTANPPKIYFKPASNSLNDDDVVISYTIKVSDNGETYSITGSQTIVIDAVASDVTMNSVAVDYTGNQTAAQSGEDITLNINDLVFVNDPSEKHYIVIEWGDLITGYDPANLPTGIVALSGTALENFGSATGIDTDNKYVFEVTDLTQFPNGDYNLIFHTKPTSGDTSSTIKINGVTVEGTAGNDKNLWQDADNREYDFTNNVTIVEKDTTIKVSEVDGAWGLTTTNAYEADTSNAHLGDPVDANANTTGTITLAMPGGDSNAGHEVVSAFTITCDASLVDGTAGTLLVFNGSTWVTLTPVISGGEATYTLPSNYLNGSNVQLRYSPGADSDADFNFKWNATITEKQSGATDVKSGEATIIVDAVADKPIDVTKDLTEIATSDSSIEVTLSATFGDYKDGSENHYLLVQVPTGLTIDTASLNATGLTYSLLSAAEIAEINTLQGGTLDPTGTYYKITVPNSNLESTNGEFSVDVTFNTPDITDPANNSLRDPNTGNYVFDGKVIAWSEETASGATEIRDDNNNSFTSGDFEVVITTLGTINVSANNTYEELDANKHGGTHVPAGNVAEYGLINVEFDAQYETLTDFELVFVNHGFDNGATVEQWDETAGPDTDGDGIADGAWVTLPFSNTSPYTITIASYNPDQPIRYNPGTQSDADVEFTWSGTMTDKNDPTQVMQVGTESGESVTLVVDAVADKPDLTIDATRDGNELEIDVHAQFYDLDGSEVHTLTIDVPVGLEPTNYPGWTLTGSGTVADPYQLTKDVTSSDGKDDTTLKFDITSDYDRVNKPPLTINADAKETTLDTSSGAAGENIVNNEANTEIGITIPEFNTEKNAFTGNDSSSFEDSRPHHNLMGGQDTEIDGSQLFKGNTASGEEFVSKVSVEAVDANGDPVGGKLIYDNGEGVTYEVEIDPLTGKATLTFTEGDDFNSKFLTFHPQGHNDSAITIESTIVVTATDTGVNTIMDPVTSNIAIDAVATLSGELKDAKASTATGTEVKLEFTTSFEDNDGSEAHYVVLQVPEGWPAIAGLPTEFYNLGDGSKLCYVIKVDTNEGTYNIESNGVSIGTITVNQDGTVNVSMSLTRPDDALSETFKVGTLVEERAIDYETENLGANYWSNNVALRPGVDIEWNINDNTQPGIDIKADNWGFENDEIYGSSPVCTIDINIMNVEQGDIQDLVFTFTNNDGSGAATGSVEYIDKDGQTHTVNLDSNGSASLPGYDKASGSITYRPEGTNDTDVSVKVELTTPEGPLTDSDTVNIDAVATPAEFFAGSDPTIVANGDIRPGGPAFMMEDLSIRFPDIDGSETHSLILEVKTGWTYTIGGVELTAEDLVVINGKTYFKFDLGDDTSSPNGVTWTGNTASIDISVKLSEFAKPESSITFKYGGMSEETNLTDSEYTTNNNVSTIITDYGQHPGNGGNPGGPGTGGPGTIHPPTENGGNGGDNSGLLIVKDYVYEVPSDESPNSAEITFTPSTTSLTITGLDSGMLTITYDDGTTYTFEPGDSPLSIGVGTNPTITFTPDASYSDTDIKLTYESAGKDGTTTSKEVTIVVDAVAQAPEDVAGDADYGIHTAAGNEGSFEIDVTVNFQDPDANTTNYVLIEAKAGWDCLDTHDTMYIEGTLYYRVEATSANTNGNVVTVNMKAPDTDGKLVNGLYEDDLKLGAVSIDKATDGEVRLDNNIAITEADSVHVTISPVDSSVSLSFSGHGYEDNLAGYDSNGFAHGDAIEGTPVELQFNGLSSTDSITNLELSFAQGSGSLTLNGTELVNGYTDGNVTVSLDGSGNTIVHFNNYDPSSNTLTFTPADGTSFDDVKFDWKADIVDTNSGETETQSDSNTLIIDAVAHKPDVDAEAEYSSTQTAAKPGQIVNIPISVTFTEASTEAGYIFIEQVAGWQIMGLADMDFTIVPKDGTPANGFVYRISVDDLPNGFTLVHNSDGTYTVEGSFEVKAPSGSSIGDKSTTIEVGGIVLESAQGQPGDKEAEVENNRVVGSEQVELIIGPVSMPRIDVNISAITEDSFAGGKITLTSKEGEDAPQNADELAQKFDEIITETTLTFESTEGMNMMGTVIYDGQAYFIDSDGKVTIDFGPNGYDSDKEFCVVWGKVETEADGTTVKTDGNGNPIVVEWNHSAGDVTVKSSSNVKDTESLEEGTNGGGGKVTITPTADAPETIIGEGPTGAVSTEHDVEITVKATFADIDGSEEHFVLVEAKAGWSCQGNPQTVTIGGTTYYKIAVDDNTDPNPSVTVVLTPPTTISNGSSVDFKVGGLSEDGDSTNSTISDTSVSVTLDGVSATGVTVSGACNEDGSAELTFTVKDGAIGDTVSEITFTLKPGESITGSDGSIHAGPTTLTLSATDIANNVYSYHPKENVSGNITLNFTADVSSGSGITVTFPNQTGSVDVTSVVDTPENVDGTANNTTAIAGHKGTITAKLSADFDDIDGSEQHFFLVQLPVGVLPPAGAILVSPDPTGLFSGSEPIYKLTVSNNSSQSLNTNFTMTQDYNGGSIIVVAGSTEKATGDTAYSDATGSVTITGDASELNIAPVANDVQTALDSLRGDTKSGTVTMSDKDGDSVSVTGVTGGTAGSDQNGNYFEVAGTYGVLKIYADGTYVYTLNQGQSPLNATEHFTYEASDGWNGAGATDEGVITINLTNANTDPTVGGTLTGSVGGLTNSFDGTVTWGDSDGDAVTFSITGENGTPQDLGASALTIEGTYGILTVNPNGSYSYQLKPEYEHMAGVKDSFTLTATDSYGATQSQDLEIDVSPVNHAPDAQNVVIGYPTNGVTFTSGVLNLADFDEDTEHAVNNDKVTLISVNGQSVPTTGDLTLIGTYGSLSIKADGTWTYVLHAGVVPSNVDAYDTFSFTVEDSYGLPSDANFYVTLGDAQVPASTGASILTASLTVVDDALDTAGAATMGTPALDESAVATPLVSENTLADTHEVPAVISETIAVEEGDNDIIFSCEDDNLIYGGPEQHTLIGTQEADTFAWSSEHSDGSVMDTVIGFNTDQGDKLSFFDLFGDVSNSSIIQDSGDTFRITTSDGNVLEAIFDQSDITISIRDSESNLLQSVEVQMSGNYSAPLDIDSAQQMLEQMIKACSDTN